jgi:universal stress protein A
MSTYNHILVVIDLSADNSQLIRRAQALAAPTLSFIHVVEYMPMEPLGETVLPALQIETVLLDGAREKLAALARQYGLSSSQQLVMAGTLKSEISRAAQQLGADLIVVGNHQRHGLKTLVNFAEDVVLHAAPCDVLAVHLPGKNVDKTA